MQNSHHHHNRLKHLILLACMVLFGPACAQAPTTLRAKHFNTEKGLAIQGYDPIAYFVSNKAMPGSKNIQATVEGITYYFATQNNKDLFLKDPKRFEPQYGGWCAYAMGAANEKVEIDPETFKIRDGKLYLFYHSWTNNTLNKWNADEKKLKPAADKNWNLIYN